MAHSWNQFNAVSSHGFSQSMAFCDKISALNADVIFSTKSLSLTCAMMVCCVTFFFTTKKRTNKNNKTIRKANLIIMVEKEEINNNKLKVASLFYLPLVVFLFPKPHQQKHCCAVCTHTSTKALTIIYILPYPVCFCQNEEGEGRKTQDAMQYYCSIIVNN